MGYSKWIFGSIGFALSGTPLGAVLGFALGSLVDGMSPGTAKAGGSGGPRAGAQGRQHQQGQTTAGDLALSLVVLTAAVMKADGTATQRELAHVRTFFNRQFGTQHAGEMLRLLRETLQRDIPLHDVCMQMRGHLSHPERLQLMHYLVGLAWADGRLDRAEAAVIDRIAGYFHISEKDLAALKAMFHKVAPNTAYEILEVDPKAADEEVKRAYRRAAVKHHPDKVAHLGEQVQKDAAEKFKKVQDAWERIKKERGLT